MRTKTMLLTAALVAAGVASSMAQSNVYSLNVVGYINLNLTNGFTMIGNQLDLDGTGTNNTLATALGTNVPVGTTAYIFNPADGNFDTIVTFSSKHGWGTTPTPLNPGQGVFIYAPTPTTVTEVGQVLQGSLTNNYLAAAGGFAMVSSMAPIGGYINTNLGYAGQVGDTIYQFNPADQNYDIITTYSSKHGWGTPPPTFNVGDGFWLYQAAPAPWVETFTVQ